MLTSVARRAARLVLFGAGLAAAAPLAASSFVMVADETLADQAAVIAEVTVNSAQPYLLGGASAARSPEPSQATGYQMQVDRLIKGAPAGGSLLVRVPGGTTTDGAGGAWVLWGAPHFEVGERLLLFLEARPDGSYRVLHLFLGAFHRRETRSGQAVLVRLAAGASEVRLEPPLGGRKNGARRDEERPRDHQRFVTWLESRASGASAPADYYVDLAPGDLPGATEKFTLFSFAGFNLRWFEFDQGAAIPFFADAKGQSGVPGGGFGEFQASLQAWNDNPGTDIRLAYGGTTTTLGSLATFNGINQVTFDDPAGGITPFECGKGGFLAYTFTYAQGPPRSFKGVQYLPITGSHIVTNKNIDCFFTSRGNPSSLAAALFTHELGHSLGLGHSCGDARSPSCFDPVLDDAIMRSNIHTDNRGTRLGSDDQSAIRLLYSSARVPPARCVPGGQTLCLDHGRFELTVNWKNQYNSTTGWAGAIRSTDQAGFFYFTDPSNVELMVKILQFGSVFKVFYGQLTDLGFSLNILETDHYLASSYQNTAGNCGGIDPVAFEAVTAGPKANGACRPDAGTLCLLGGRFAVTVQWSNPGNNTSGNGSATSFSDQVGTFFFTDPANVELMTKLVAFPDRIAFFWGALSDLPYTITVSDTASGSRKTYQSTA